MSSLLVRVRLTPAPPHAPWSLVLTFGHPRQTGWAYRSAYRVETAVYCSPPLRGLDVVRRPRCYYAHLDPARPRFVLVLQDVAVAAGGQLRSRLGADQVSRVVRDLAHLHAVFWERSVPEQPGMAEMADFLLFGAGGDYLAERVVPELRARLGEAVPTCLGDREQIQARLQRHRGTLVEGPGLTLVHGDVHPGNLIYARRDGPPTWVDWQCVTRMRSVYDLALFLGVNVPTPLGRLHEDEWFSLYTDELDRRGITCTVDDLRRAYPAALLFAGLRWLEIGSVLLRRGEADLAETLVRRVGAVFCDWAVWDRTGAV